MKIVFVARIIRNIFYGGHNLWGFYHFFSKITLLKIISDCCDKFDYPGSIVYLSCFICNSETCKSWIFHLENLEFNFKRPDYPASFQSQGLANSTSQIQVYMDNITGLHLHTKNNTEKAHVIQLFCDSYFGPWFYPIGSIVMALACLLVRPLLRL